jgi:uncharacterized protein (TIGR03086 family)
MLIIEADAAAVRDTLLLTAAITAADLGRPTPCAGWDLRALLAHLTAQHRGFAAATRGRGGDPAVWQPRESTDPVADHAAAAADVLAAFGDPERRDEFDLPELSTGRPVPAATAIGFHLVDYVVHGWDVARTLGAAYRPAPAVLAAALPIARAVPDGPFRQAPGAAFAPAVPVPPGAGPLDEILLRLGRRP